VIILLKTLKGKAYKSNPHIGDELAEIFRPSALEISRQDLKEFP